MAAPSPKAALNEANPLIKPFIFYEYLNYDVF